MYSLLLLGVVSFLSALLLTPVIRDEFRRLGCFDNPDSARKLHTTPIPRVGGIAVATAYVIAFSALLVVPLSAGDMVVSALPAAMDLLPAAALIFIVGLVDDLWGLRPWQKLAGQVLAASLAVAAGVRIHGLMYVPLGPWLCSALTIVWLVGCTNAFNLIDGMDGLAAGVGISASMTMMIAALLSGNIYLAIATVPLVGALLGFLRYNFNPASIFLGDSGSLLVGFLLGAYGVLWSQKEATILGMTAPLMALAVPLLDTGLAIARRFLRRQPIFGADRGHIHHKLLARGLTVRRAVVLIYGMSGLGAGLALLVSSLHDHYAGLVIVLFCGCTWIGIQHLGYVEFGTARRMIIAGAFRRQLNVQISLNTFIEELSQAETPDECWRALCSTYRDFGFTAARAALRGDYYCDGNDLPPDARAWDLTIPLSDTDWVSLSRDFRASAEFAIPAAFADRIRAALLDRLDAIAVEAEPIPLRALRATP